jgi:2-polyprenyl-6-methoxyphenol hydroxylase-like FAD-dependent oxidoreductase
VHHTPVPERHDVVVVGARAAGAATALLLARAGFDVLVLDQGHYGADTLSTHALMRPGVVQLHRWGLLDAVVAAGTPPVRTTTFRYADSEIAIPVRPAFGVDALYAPRRTVLDPILVDAAQAAGATFRYGVSVTFVTRDEDGRVDGVIARDRRGRTLSCKAGWVVGADGIRSRVAAAVGAPTEVQGSAATASVYGYWEGLADDGYEWTFRRNACTGVIPTNDGRACVFASASPERLARAGMEGFRAVVREASPELADRLSDALPLTGVRSFPGLPGYLRRAYGPGWALVGDAGYWKDPLSTHGITDALRDAELLARAVLAAPEPGPARAAALAGYQEVRDRLSMPMLAVVERLASYDWDLDEVRTLLRELTGTMTDEVELLAGLPVAA